MGGGKDGAQPMPPDRVGLGWRPALASPILSHLDRIDAVEVLLDDYFGAAPRKLRALKTLERQVPVIYHGVGLGLASAFPIAPRRMDRLARVLDFLGPETWSEHLAFVRAGEFEIGHLAAPPRTEATVEGALENLERIRKATGGLPALENIATLIDPPGSTLGEAAWTGSILSGSGALLLLDLHNLLANALNTGKDPFAFLSAFPLQRVGLVHLSGGHWIREPAGYGGAPGAERLLDDHVHDVPGIVFDLLEALARECHRPLTVIIERDGEYPEFPVLLAQIEAAREALRRGRAARNPGRAREAAAGPAGRRA